jgi:hypothetical protein
VFENKVLRRYSNLRERECKKQMEIFKELHDLNLWQNKITVIKLRRMRWTGHVAHMEENRNADRVYVKNPGGKRFLQDLGVDGRIILKWFIM